MLFNIEHKILYKCPNCGEGLTEEEAEQVCDEGCPCCRMIFDVEDNKIN